MSWTIGTATLTNGSAVVTKTGGVDWSNPLNGVREGRMIIDASNVISEILRVDNANQLTLRSAYTGTTGSKSYRVPTSPDVSLDAMALDQAAFVAYFQGQIGGYQQLLTGTGNVTITAPDGTSVTVRSQSEWDSLLNKKVTLDTEQVIVGKKVFRQNWESLQLTNESLGQPVYISARDFDGSLRWVLGYETPDANYLSLRNNKANTVILFHSNRNIYVECVDFVINNNTVWTSGNTVVDSGGFIKRASPVINIYADGKFEVTKEAEGISVERIGEGVYKITGCQGMHSDAAWNGIDGGISNPKCRNGLDLVWNDFRVEEDGSIIVKTYHRPHPEAVSFARNEIEGYESGDPIDIPKGMFIQVRVNMPERESEVITGAE
uniref:Tail fiber protein n=2 Tax=unclassified Caudoviricetes TaxID=2788787 RepID=A0AB39AC75_9CAUD